MLLFLCETTGSYKENLRSYMKSLKLKLVQNMCGYMSNALQLLPLLLHNITFIKLLCMIKWHVNKIIA